MRTVRTFGLCKLPPEIEETILEFPFQSFPFRRYKKSFLLRNFFGVSVFLKYKKFSRGRFFLFFELEVKRAEFHLRKYKKSFLLRKCKKFFNIRARKSYFRKYKKASFWESITIFFNIRAWNFSWNLRNFFRGGEGYFLFFRAWAGKWSVPFPEIWEKIFFEKIWEFF